MLTTAAFLYATGRSRAEEADAAAPRAGAARRKMWTLASPDGAGIFITLLVFVIGLLRYVGACTIVARSNPKMSQGALILVFVLFLLFSDVYLLYFSLRWGIVGLRGLMGRRVVDYATLPYPRGSAPASASQRK